MSVTVSQDTGDFTPALGCLVRPAVAGLAAQLGSIAGLGAAEREALCAGVTEALYDTVHRKVSRVLILELNGARVTGQLRAADERARWEEFLAIAGRPAFWDGLARHYPGLPARLDRVIGNRVGAGLSLARRFAADRRAVGKGDLLRVGFGAGDSHRGGQTVALLDCEAGPVVYKPRSVRPDVLLNELICRLLPDRPPSTRIRAPYALERDGYGWAEHITHRYCAGEDEFAHFYRGIGHWLALMRLVGGVDLHFENLIACGPVPIVVDCETLFMPTLPGVVSGDGGAVDHAADLLDTTVLRTGLLPSRGVVLGWRGVDPSAVGAIPGQQPWSDQPVIVDAGTDRARIGIERVPNIGSANLPGAEPELARYWGRVMEGFDELAERVEELDRTVGIEPLLRRFADCPIRVVARVTEAYSEVMRMLWHPVSLHDPQPAVERAAKLLIKMNELLPVAPDDPEVVAAEIEDLLDGDVPFFTTTPARGRLEGPRGTHWLPERDLIADTLARWRGGDLALERQVIQATLVSAYLNEGWTPGEHAMTVDRLDVSDLDSRRRALAAGIMKRLSDRAIRAPEDGTVTWIAPVLSDNGWSVQHLSRDLYAGSHGVALLLAGYLREQRAGRADPVPGLEELWHGLLLTIRKIEDRGDKQRREGMVLRPEPPGAYLGLGSQIWSWLLQESFGVDDALERAVALARLMPEAVKADDSHDLLLGMAGAIPSLLRLASRTGQHSWVEIAADAGHRLAKAALLDARGARWPGPRWPDGIGGFAHGATGIGWALGTLAAATGEDLFARLATEAHAFEESAYDPVAKGWRDLRDPVRTASAWCHGSVGIGVSTQDNEVRKRASEATWADGLGWNHTLCHGDTGSWELLSSCKPDGVEQSTLDAYVIGSLEQHGPISGLARDTFSPGLLPGLGGVAYQLLRMHPGCDLPSVLLP